MTVALVLEWLRTGQLQLPLPGSGQTALRWHQLARLAQIDVVAGRLAEAHRRGRHLERTRRPAARQR
jgi:hypothetical protein